MNFNSKFRNRTYGRTSHLHKLFMGIVLAVAFTLVLGTLLSGVLGFNLFSGQVETTNLAEATDGGGGGTTAIALSPTIEQFVGETSTNYTDTYTHTFNNGGVGTLGLDPPTNTLSWYYTCGGSSKGSATTAGNAFTFDAADHGLFNAKSYIAINFKLTSTYLHQLMSNSLATVSARFTYTLSFGSNNDFDIGSKIQQSGGVINASAKNTTSTSSYNNGSESGIHEITNTVNLSTANFTGTDATGRSTFLNILFYCEQGWSRTMIFTASDMKVDIIATFPLESGKPRLTSGTILNPVTSIANQPVTFSPADLTANPDLQTNLSANLDSVLPTATDVHKDNINMLSYRRTYTTSPYYKQVTTLFYDYYGTTKDTGGSASCSGLRRIEFGDEGIYYVYSGTSQTSSIIVDGVNVGSVTFTKTNKSYVTAVFKFTKNGSFSVSVVDFVGNSNSTTITVSGIDFTAPDAPQSNTDGSLIQAPSAMSAPAYAAAYAGATWWNEATYLMEVDALGADDGEAMVVYFYNVSYSRTGEYGTFTDLANNTYSYPSTPGTYGRLFSVGNVTTLELNFSELSGSGYYMIGLQAKDLAGNTSTYNYETRYMIKVDTESPEYTVELTKGTGSTPYISGTWATDQIKAKLTVTTRNNSANAYHSETNLSGNMLSYMGADYKDHYVIVLGGVITSSDAFGTLDYPGTTEAVYTDGTFTITYLHGVFTIICGNISYLESETLKYNNVDFAATFKMYLGDSVNTDFYYPSGQDMIDDDPTILFRSDRNNPMTPVISDDQTSKLTPTIYYDLNIPIADRDWYTDDWFMGVVTTFSDDMLEDYSDEIKIYIGLNVNSFASDFSTDTVLTQFLGGSYASYDACLSALGYFDDFMSVTASQIDGGSETFINLLQSHGSGLRNIYVWVLDQAGNTSISGSYQVLVDANTYEIQALVDSANLGHFGGMEFASIEYANDVGDLVTSFMRGEKLFITVSIASGFVPYKITQKLGAGVASDIFVNNALSTEYIQQEMDDLLLTMEGLNLQLHIEKDDITQTPSTLNQIYTFSFRKIVSLSLGNTVVFYNGTQNGIGYFVTIEDSDETFVGFPSSNFSEFVGIYYTSYLNPEEFTLTTGENGSLTDGGAPKNVGLYTVKAQVNGQFYISEPAITTYRINKLAVSLSANAGRSDFGDEIVLLSTLGVVGDDIENVPEPISGYLKLQNWTSLVGVPAGNHNIVMGEPLVYQNYSITYTSAIYTVDPKSVNITITESQGKQFGDADPIIGYTVDEGQTLVDDISAIILGGGVIRENGESATVDGYAYSSSNAGFLLNPNYVLNIQSTDNFVITKRTIGVTPLSSQSAVIGSQYEILYKLNSIDRKYSQYLTGALEIDGVPVVGASNAIGIGTLTIVMEMADNLDLTILGSVMFTLIAAGDVVIVPSSLNNVITFGDACPSAAISTMFNFSTEKFAVSGLESYEYFNIVWEWAIGGYVAGNDVGNYLVDITNIFVYAGDDQETAENITSLVSVTIGSVFLQVKPATISVSISNSNFTRVYGSDEVVLTYNITSSVGTSQNWNVVNGNFRRVIYNSNGDLVAVGTRYDSTNAGLVAVYGAGHYYGLAIENEFSCNSNYAIEYTNVDDIRFTIVPYQIQLTINAFNGKSREYNALTAVGYVASDNAIIFDKARATDSVSINFTANYNTADVAVSNKSITFSNLSLSGASSTNYVLYYQGTPVDGGTTVTITKMSSQSDSNDIAIYAAELNILKADIKVSKTYDGTTAITGNNINFLRGVLATVPQASITVSGVYPQKGIGTSLAVDVTVTVELANANRNFTIATSEEENFEVSSTDSSIVIVATLLDADILARVLTLQSFIFTGVDKRYDSTSSASVEYQYVQGALGEGDTKTNVATSFVASFVEFTGEDQQPAVNAGEWTVMLESATLSNPNYNLSVSAQDFELYTSIKANILPTRLVLDIAYDANRQYDGTSVVDYTTSFNLKVFGDDHINEAELALLSYELVSVLMSKNGVENTQVMFTDSSKKTVAKHNVMFTGVRVTAEEGALLSNFVLLGYRYNSGTSGYDLVEMELTNGAVDSFEMIEAANLKKRELDIQTSSITINDKFYDATTNGKGSINKNTIGIVESEKSFIGMQFSVQFTSVDVHSSVKAYIRVQQIINEAAAGDTDYAINYTMKDVEGIYAFGYAAIKQAPLTFDIALSNKVYDATRRANISSYTLYGVIDARDFGKYTLSYAFGAFSSINAGEVVSGSAYGLVLSYNGYSGGTGSYMNYVLTYTMTATEWEAEHGEAIVSEHSNYYLTKTVNDVVTHYFTLDTKQFSKILSTDYDSETYGYVYYNKVEGGSTYYYVDYTGLGDAITLNCFEAAAGRISKKVVTVTASLTESGQAALQNRVYDGTRDFIGVEGVDYTISISGICMGEAVTISQDGFSVLYDNANASAIKNDRVLVFRITGLSGENAGNYSFSGATASMAATIARANVDVSIDNIIVEYGDGTRSYVYHFDDGIHDLYVLNGKLGYDGDHDNDPETPNQFIVLDANIKLPTVIDVTNNFKDAGVYPLGLTAGNSTNYNFNFLTSSYTGVDENGNDYDYQDVAGIITIKKVVLYAYATDRYQDTPNVFEYKKNYRAANPEIVLGYSSSLISNVNGLKNGQTPSGLISAGTGLFNAPLAKFRKLDTVTGIWGANVDTESVVNTSLVNTVYGVHLDMTNTQCRNYIILARYEEQYAQNNTNLADYVEQLLITFAEIEGIVFKNVTKTYNGQVQSTTYSGNMTGDQVSMKAYLSKEETYDNNGVQATRRVIDYENEIALNQVVNAGTYFFEITVKRTNYLDWVGIANVKINPKQITLGLKRLVVNYDRNTHTITENRAVVIGDNAVDPRDITFIYKLNGEKLANGVLPQNAGSYLAQACFDPQTATHTVNASNYAYSTSDAVALIINPVIVNIKVDKKQLIYDEDGDNELEYEAIIDSAFEGFDLPNISVNYRDSYSDASVNYISYAGTYSFAVTTQNPNYLLTGNTTGVFIVGIGYVVEYRDDDSDPRASATAKEGSLIYANTQLRYEVKPNNSNNSTLWSQVNSNVNVIGTFFAPLETSAIVDVSMITEIGDSRNKVQPNGEIVLTMDLPKGAANGDRLYVVTSSGELRELNYTYESGKIVVTTDYVSTFVFVKQGSFPWWLIGVVGGVVALGAMIAIIVLVKKKKLFNDMQLVTVGANSDGSPIQITVKEKREREALELQRQEAEKKRLLEEKNQLEKMQRQSDMASTAAQASQPHVRGVMKAASAERIATGKMVSASKAVASDLDSVQPKAGIKEALPVDEAPVRRPAPTQAGPPVGKRPSPPPRPVGAPPRPAGAPPRPVGAPPTSEKPPTKPSK